MKKISFIMIFILCLCLPFSLVACGDNTSESSDSQTDSTVYKVTCDSSDYYTFGGTVSSTSGNTAEVILKSNFPAFEITGCTFNGNECTKISEEGTEEQRFNYIMPKSNVKIKVLYRWKDLEKSGKNDFLNFESNNEYTISINNGVNLETQHFIYFNTDVRHMTVANISCFSTNEEVLPNASISVINKHSNNSNEIIGGSIIIDRSQLKTGTTQIVLRVANQNTLSYDAIIVATITII